VTIEAWIVIPNVSPSRRNRRDGGHTRATLFLLGETNETGDAKRETERNKSA